jgi:AAA15 family ATPase/GTPase
MIITEKITAFYGQNGSGKTSVLKKIASTHKDIVYFYNKKEQEGFRYNVKNTLLHCRDINIINAFLPLMNCHTGEVISPYSIFKGCELYFKHINKDDNVLLTYDEQSDGIKKLVCLLPMIINAIQEDELLFIDDIETFLNPKIVKFIIELFKKSKTGKLIFSSNDTNTMLQLKHKNIKLVRGFNGEIITEDIPANCTVKKFKKDFDNGKYGCQPIIQDEAFFYKIDEAFFYKIFNK